MRSKRNRRIGSAQISEFSVALAVFFFVLLFPLINLISLSAAYATGFLAAKYAANRAGDSIDYMEAITAAAAASKEITSSGLGKFAALKPVGGYDNSGMNLYLTDTNISTNVNIVHGPNTPAVSALDQEKYLYAYDTVLTYDVGPFLNLSALPLVGNVAGLGKPVRMTFQANRAVEHLNGVTVSGGGWIQNGSVVSGSTSSSTILAALPGGNGGGSSSTGGGIYAFNSNAGSTGAQSPQGAGVATPMAAPRRPWQTASTNGISRDIPNVLSSFHVQLTGVVDFNLPVDVFDTDLYETTAENVATIHANGGYAIAYMNTGAWQPGMPDSDSYPPEVLGKKPMKGWPQERWIDIRQIELLRPIIAAKIALAKSKGFNAVDPDNMDGYTNDEEFGLTKADQIAFNKMVAEEAHKQGMAIMLKNAGSMMADLVNDFDGTMAEEAYKYKEADIYQPMRDAGKPVFLIEYGRPKKAEIADAIARGFNMIQAKKPLKKVTKMITPS
jgi:endo-alpha-1,4-polygalactosaminidase (GH114 family)